MPSAFLKKKFLKRFFSENHAWLESLYDADDTVAEIRAMDNLFNGQISIQAQEWAPNQSIRTF